MPYTQPIGNDPAFLAILEQASRLAPLSRPVLVIGERGTGKELIAARLHYLAARWEGPFIKVNCATLSESLLESELFGHEAGAFTGAHARHAGRFERADQGSIFLDEIATASLRVQENILRVIEYGELERVGGAAPVQVDVRVIAATNLHLPDEVAAGRFRADLLDRLAFDVITVPPLRARPRDIPLLAEHFARQMARELGWAQFPGFTSAAMAMLQNHDWPGNVRELKNVVERAVYRAADPAAPVAEIVFDPFASAYRPATPPAGTTRNDAQPPPQNDTPPMATEQRGFRRQVQDFERGLLKDALEQAGGNQKLAARALGLGYHQFRRLAVKHGLAGRSTAVKASTDSPRK